MQFRVKENCICHIYVEVKIQICCTLIANEMEDELYIIFNTSLEHESDMSQIKENILSAVGGIRLKMRFILGNIFVFAT